MPTVCGLSAGEVDALSKSSHFNPEEVKAVWLHFRWVSSSGATDAPQLNKAEFTAALGMKTSTFLDRMFAAFDANSDGSIEFSEFLTILSVLSSKATPEEKLEFAFKITDIDGDGVISREELAGMLKATVEENDLVLSDAQLQSVVDATFAEIPGAKGGITLAQYGSLAGSHPMMLSQLNMNVSSIIAEQLKGGEIPLA